jgi:hypothetical protein
MGREVVWANGIVHVSPTPLSARPGQPDLTVGQPDLHASLPEGLLLVVETLHIGQVQI